MYGPHEASLFGELPMELVDQSATSSSQMMSLYLKFGTATWVHPKLFFGIKTDTFWIMFVYENVYRKSIFVKVKIISLSISLFRCSL